MARPTHNSDPPASDFYTSPWLDTTTGQQSLSQLVAPETYRWTPYTAPATGGGDLTSGPVTSSGGVSAIADGALGVSMTSGLSDALAGKQSTGDYATNTALTSGLAGKVSTGGLAGTVSDIGNLTGIVTSTNRATSIADGAIAPAKITGTALIAADATEAPTASKIVIRDADSAVSAKKLILDIGTGQTSLIPQAGAAGEPITLPSAGPNMVVALTDQADGSPRIPAASITDSTALGRSLITAATASAALTELGAGATGKSLLESATQAVANTQLGRRVFVKTSDETLTNSELGGRTLSTDFGNDAQLANIPLDANGIYRIEWAIFGFAVNTELLKIKFTYPARAFSDVAGGAVSCGAWGNAAPTNTNGGSTELALANHPGGSQIRCQTGWATLNIGAAIGDLSLKWGKVVAGASASTIKAGSYIIVSKLN